MRLALLIICLMALGAYLLTTKLAGLSVLCFLAMFGLIQADKGGNAIENFFAFCFGLSILGMIWAGIARLISWL